MKRFRRIVNNQDEINQLIHSTMRARLMVRHARLVSTKWMPTRLWSGSLPSFHLLSREETQLEKKISKLYFASYRFADLRMQIRLKLKELPANSQLLRSDYPMLIWDILELFDEYLPLLLSVQKYHSARYSTCTTLPYILTIFPPLFYGFGDLDMLNDRFVGKLNRAEFCIPVEIQLVLCAMAQLYAMHAESQLIQEGDNLISSYPRIQYAELSWQSAESFYHWATSHSRQIKGGLDSTKSLTLPMWKFFNAMEAYTAILSCLCSTHRLLMHISGLTFTEMRPEQLTRIGSVCARRALTLVTEANSLQSRLTESSFFRQIKWCLSAYEIRWMAIYFQCESTIYRLDANPEIAIYFCEQLLKLRIPHFSSPSSMPQDSSFSLFVHEIQLKHHGHLNEALDDKKALLDNYGGRVGTTAVFQLLDKHLAGELLLTRKMGPVFNDEQFSMDNGAEEEETNYTSPFLVEVITANVDEAIKMEDPESSLFNEIEIIITKKHENQSTKSTCSKNLTTVISSKNANPKSQTEMSLSKQNQEEDSPTKASTSDLLKQRPSSSTSKSSGWVTMNYGGKLLHFERSSETPPVNQLEPQRKAGLEQNNISDNSQHSAKQTKPRPSSSPCYLSSRRKTLDKTTISAGGIKDNTKMWAPTRALCALCEQRFMRSSLPGVVVMKRVYDVRRRWGVIQDSKKFHAPSLLYGTANVCLLCQEILAYEETKHTSKSADAKMLNEQQLQKRASLLLDTNVVSKSISDNDDGIGRMIHDSIMHRWHQQPPSRSNDSNLDDIAVNKRVRQSSTVCSMKAQNALDPDINRTAHTKEELQPWWEIDLGNYVEVHSVKVYLRDEVSRLYTAARDLAANPGRHTSGVYPLHICISMRSGIGRDCGDIVASSVSSLCVTDKVAPLIEWVAPQKSRGRFVRIQSEGRAVLHIERVQVFEAKAVIDPVVRRQHFRQKLQRAAICASALATTVTPLTKSSRVAVSAGNQSVNKAESEYQPPSTSFFDSDRAEKKRMSRLYTRFKSLLDARAKYYAPEKGTDEEDEGENPL